MNKHKQVAKYLFFDFLASISSWTLFFLFRKIFIEQVPTADGYLHFLTPRYYTGLIAVSLFWFSLHYLSGYYKDIYRRSRLKELGQTIQVTVIGMIVIFFLLILDDEVVSYKNYYQLFFFLLVVQFVLTYVPRVLITTSTNHKIRHRKIGFNTLIIGSKEEAVKIYNEIDNQKASTGNYFIGYLTVNNNGIDSMDAHLTCLGKIDQVKEVIDSENIEEVILAISPEEHNKLGNIMNTLADCNVIIKAIPDMYDILTGRVKMNQIYGTPLIQISHEILPIWQYNTKRFLDYSVAAIALIITLPLTLPLALLVKLSSKGPVFYTHERIGRFGKPFHIYKFRSMYTDAENTGPQLSSKNDDRITKVGRVMRKLRLDEIPNFLNVLKGDMSLVGPRPERQFFIDQIVARAPHYTHLLKVRPGITSWGQVKYGYAENVDEMIERLKYDILYIENMSLYVDFKILIYTVLTVIRGRGV